MVSLTTSQRFRGLKFNHTKPLSHIIPSKLPEIYSQQPSGFSCTIQNIISSDCRSGGDNHLVTPIHRGRTTNLKFGPTLKLSHYQESAQIRASLIAQMAPLSLITRILVPSYCGFSPVCDIFTSLCNRNPVNRRHSILPTASPNTSLVSERLASLFIVSSVIVSR